MTTSVSSAQRVSLVVAPTFAFDRLERAMASAGWTRESVQTAMPSILPDEPELAAFRSQRHQVRATYTFNPAVRFRVLALSGGDVDAAAAELTEALPLLDLEAIRDFLGATDERLILMTLFAARELRLYMAADRIAPLRAHPNPRIAQLAEKTMAELTQQAVDDGMRHLQSTGASIFPLTGDRHVRRQIVRWLIHDFNAATPEISSTLRAALADEDWEVRASAMIAAVRWNATEFGGAIRDLVFPETTRDGADRTDRGILHAMQKEALAMLAGSQEPAATPMVAHLRDCMLGKAVSQHDRVFLFVHSLAQPLQNEGVESTVQHGIEMVRVEAVDHWIGAGDPDIAGNPIRVMKPERPFFIATRPLSASQAISLLSGRPAPESSTAYRCAESEARQILRALNMTCPTAAQWEMAMRGTDGRRRPWGNGWEGDPAGLPSAWGLGGLTRDGEWAMADEVMIVRGGDREMRCAWLRAAKPGEALALRPVFTAD
jgi:hypothetical protein